MEKNLFTVEENIYLLQGIRSCNIYFFDFKKKAILDTGFSAEIKDNLALLEKKGLNIKNIDFIINTHSHGDHVGGNSYLKKINPSAKIIGSENTKFYQDERKKISLLEGAEDDFENYEIDTIVKENDLIDLGGCILKVIETPGHTRDSLSFYIENKNIAFTGDVVYYQVVSQVDYYQDLLKSLSELKESYNKLLNLNASCFYPGHSVAIKNPNDNFNICLRKIARFERQPELIIINNFIPSAEYYVYKNPGCTEIEIKNFFLENMLKFRSQPFLNQIGEKKFEDMIDKMISLMRIMNMIKEENEKLFLANKINQNLNKGLK